MLGDSYWLVGQLHRAISEHKKSKEIATKNLMETQEFNDLWLWNKLRRYKVVSLFNVGLCKIDLWEVEEAVEIFEEVLIEAKKETLERYCKEIQFCLAFLNSFLGNSEKAHQFATEAYCLIDSSIQRTNNDLSKWSLGYCFLFLGATYKNLRDTEKSFDLFQGAISFATESQYPQVKAKALTGLAELYRSQQDFEQALLHHSESIELLEKISAKCDLAEAYFQIGLTYKATGEVERSKKYANQAIQLYREMQAPKQIERVHQLISNAES